MAICPRVDLSDLLCAMSDPAAEYLPNRNGVEVHTFEAPNIYGPPIKWLGSVCQLFRRGIAGAPERQDAAIGAEKILCGPATPLIQHQVFPRGQQLKTVLRHAMI